jgi:hypothetical protein
MTHHAHPTRRTVTPVFAWLVAAWMTVCLMVGLSGTSGGPGSASAPGMGAAARPVPMPGPH